jgi:hypothetical protein
MEVQFTPEQEARLAQIASIEGMAPALFVQDAALRLLDAEERLRAKAGADLHKACPECGHRFQGKGWDGIDAHWRSAHKDLLPYELAWPLIRTGSYDSPEREDAEDIFIAENRLAELRAGRSRTHSLEEVERELGLVD